MGWVLGTQLFIQCTGHVDPVCMYVCMHAHTWLALEDHSILAINYMKTVSHSFLLIVFSPILSISMCLHLATNWPSVFADSALSGVPDSWKCYTGSLLYH